MFYIIASCVSIVIASLLFVAPSVAAEPQAGGVPELDNRLTAVEALVSTLQTNITTLQTKVVELEKANGDLASELNSERAARIAGDLQLFTGIQTERNTRTSEDQAIRQSIEANRVEVFAGTQSATFLPNGNETVIAQLGLEAGTYLILAKTGVANDDHSARWSCSLYQGSSFLDGASIATEGGDTFLNFTPLDPSKGNMFLQALTHLDASATITVKCHSGEPSSQIWYPKLIALRIPAGQ